MPKIGKPVDIRPYVLRCVICGCWPLDVAHDRFTVTGNAVGRRYICQVLKHWHTCSDETRDGCKPERVYCLCKGEDEDPECLVHGVQKPPGEGDPWLSGPPEIIGMQTPGYSDEHVESWGDPWGKTYNPPPLEDEDPTAWGYEGTWPPGG